MRLFTGLSLPDAALLNLERRLRNLRPLASIRWSPLANLHITTKFIGEYPDVRLPELITVLRSIRSPIFQLQLRGFGWFPGVLWAGVEGGAELSQLALITAAALEPLGIPIEDRPYHAHLTLARAKAPGKLNALHDAVNLLASEEIDCFPVTVFHLYRSAAGIYHRLESFPFQ